MTKINKIIFAVVLVMLINQMKSQTCISPIILPDVDVLWPQTDSFSITSRWFKFKADQSQLIIDAYLKNYNFMVHNIILYEDNCTTLPLITTTTTVSGNNLTITTPTLTIGNYYLIKIENNSGVYLTYRFMKRNISSSTPLGCSTVTCANTPTCEYVCNGGFECLNTYTTSTPLIEQGAVPNWTTANLGSPDIFSSSYPFGSLRQLPCNSVGYTSAYLGSNCAGLIPVYGINPPPLFAEYLETQLLSPLTAGKTYSVSFWVKKADYYHDKIKELGMFLTSTQIANTGTNTYMPITNYTFAASTTNTVLLNDYSNWKNVIFTYTAFGGEQFLTIGVTTTAISTPTLLTPPTTPTCSFSSNTVSLGYLYIDEVSLREVVTTPTMAFNLPSSICPYNTIPLNALATPTGGVFSGTGVTNSSNSYSFNASQSLPPGTYTISYIINNCSNTGTITSTITINPSPTISISATSTSLCPSETATLTALGNAISYTWQTISSNTNVIIVNPSVFTTYTLIGTNSVNCTSTSTININPIPLQTLTLSATNTLVCSNSNSFAIITANGASSYTWLPGNLTGSSVTITPTSTTIYTVTGTYFNCVTTNTISINAYSYCCTSTISAFSGSAFPTTTLSGLTYDNPLAFNNDVEIPSGVNITLSNAEFLFAPNVKITVKSGANLQIRGAHLYACGTDMWQGIVVESGGKLSTVIGSPNTNLIEDAITAIDVSGHSTSTLTGFGAILDINNAVFNKNLIAVKIATYQTSASIYPFKIANSVFTCRSLTFTPTSWPNSLTSGLRAATNPTNGLEQPYLLQNFAFTNLKSPYSYMPSQIGVLIYSVGTTTGSTYRNIQIGSTASTTDYNIFDGLQGGIETLNSNLLSLNNVYQNTKQWFYTPPFGPGYWIGGTALLHNLSNTFNANLNVTANSTNPAFGNRYYNCHTGIHLVGTYNFICQYATFRSTQSSTNTAYGPGNTGILAQTNRFNYNISNNSIANINTAINIPLWAANYNFGTPQYGIYASQLLIQNNYIGSQTTTAAGITTQYVNQGIHLSSPVGSTFQVASANFAVNTNTINRVLRGIEINGLSKTNYPANTNTNVITLLNDNIFNATQNAIRYTNNATGTVRGNTVSAVNTTNTLVTLFYAGGCTNNPTVTCNTLSNSWQAFEYNAPNSNVFWRGNKMQSHARGLVLNNNGIIGTQGSSGNPSDNQWNGSWAGVFGTYIGASSAAQNSPIWYRSSGGIYAPPTPSGVVAPQFHYGQPNTLFTTTGSFNCGGSPPPPPSSMIMYSTNFSYNSTNLSDEEKYIEEYSKYSNIKNEPSLSSFNQNYLSSQNNSSVDKFYQLNDLYYSGNMSVANSLNSAVSPTNNVEYNYKMFYNLYYKYSSGNFSTTDDYSLQQLSDLCPGINGAVIYQARALRSYIKKTVYTYNDNCDEIKYSARENTFTTLQEQKNNPLQVDLYPNPANNFVTLVSKQEAEHFTIKLMDVNGKILINEKVQTNKFIVNLKLDLQNGIYFVDIVNDKNEKTVKKLVISK